MDRYVGSARGRQAVERGADLGDRLVAAIERRSEDRDDPDRVLVAHRGRLLGAEVEAVALHRHEPRLDFPVAAELLPAHLDVHAGHEVRSVGRLAGRTHPLAPAPLQRHPAEHRGLARAGRRRAGHVAVAGRVPHATDDVHAAAFDLGRLRILVLVDHVLVGRLGHERTRPRRHPGGHERRQIQPGAAVEQQLVGEQVVRDLGAGSVGVERVAREIHHALFEHQRGTAGEFVFGCEAHRALGFSASISAQSIDGLRAARIIRIR